MAAGNGATPIGDVAITPEAEPHSSSAVAGVAAQAEANFYTQSGVHHWLQHNQQNLGWLGKFFGSNSAAPTNIAGFVIICSLVLILVSFFTPANPEISEVRKYLGSVILSALGFVFGASTRK